MFCFHVKLTTAMCLEYKMQIYYDYHFIALPPKTFFLHCIACCDLLRIE